MAKLKLKIDQEAYDKLDEAIQALYVKDGDEYTLEAEAPDDGGKVKDLTTKLDEFRNTNIDLKKNLKALEDKYAGVDLDELKTLKEKIESFAGVDVEEYNELKKKEDAIKNKKLIDEGKFQELLDEHTVRLNQENDKKVDDVKRELNVIKKELSDTKKERDKAQNLFTEKIINEAFYKVSSSSDLGLQDGAIDVILPNVREHFELKEDQVVHRTEGTGVAEYLQSYVKERPFLIKPSTGSGTPPGGGGGGQNGAAVKISGADAKDPQKYRAAKQLADERKTSLVVE